LRSIHINLSPFKKSLYFIIPNDEDSSEDSTILKQRKHKYDGHEFIYSVEGELTVIIEEQEFVLKENESKMSMLEKYTIGAITEINLLSSCLSHLNKKRL